MIYEVNNQSAEVTAINDQLQFENVTFTNSEGLI